MLFNVRFQRLDAWLNSNNNSGLSVPIFFADYETSVYGRRSYNLSPLEDLQRFFRYGWRTHVTMGILSCVWQVRCFDLSLRGHTVVPQVA